MSENNTARAIDREAIGEMLRHEVEKAEAALKQAGSAERLTAREALKDAVQRLNDFIISGKLPG